MKNKNKKLASVLLLAMGFNMIMPSINSKADTRSESSIEEKQSIKVKNPTIEKLEKELDKAKIDLIKAKNDLKKQAQEAIKEYEEVLSK